MKIENEQDLMKAIGTGQSDKQADGTARKNFKTILQESQVKFMADMEGSSDWTNSTFKMCAYGGVFFGLANILVNRKRLTPKQQLFIATTFPLTGIIMGTVLGPALSFFSVMVPRFLAPIQGQGYYHQRMRELADKE